MESELNFIGAVLILSAAIIPAYLSIKLRGTLRNMTLSLTAFIGLHGIYHIASMQGMELLSDGILEPASVIALIAFGSIYLGISYMKQKQKAVER